MMWLVMALWNDGRQINMSVTANNREEALRTALDRAYVLSVGEAVEMRKRPALLGEEVPVRREGHCLVEAGGDRRWVLHGEPEEDWWVEITPQGIAYQDDWEYNRDANTVACMAG